MRAKVPQEPGRPSHFHRPTGKGNPVTNPGPAAWRPTPAGEGKEAGARWERRAKETKRGAREGRASQHSRSTCGAGEPIQGTPWREGDAVTRNRSTDKSRKHR